MFNCSICGKTSSPKQLMNRIITYRTWTDSSGNKRTDILKEKSACEVCKFKHTNKLIYIEDKKQSKEKNIEESKKQAFNLSKFLFDNEKVTLEQLKDYWTDTKGRVGKVYGFLKTLMGNGYCIFLPQKKFEPGKEGKFYFLHEKYKYYGIKLVEQTTFENLFKFVTKHFKPE